MKWLRSSLGMSRFMRRLSIHLDAAKIGVSPIEEKADSQSPKVYLTPTILQNFVFVGIAVLRLPFSVIVYFLFTVTETRLTLMEIS